MDKWWQVLITVLGTIAASTGFWSYIQRRADKKDVKTEMLIGLGHDRILYLGLKYLERGDWITQEEYENLNDYLYKPYKRMGGNGSAERIMQEVNTKLRICKGVYKVGEETTCSDSGEK
jgi:hypothetical protein